MFAELGLISLIAALLNAIFMSFAMLAGAHWQNKNLMNCEVFGVLSQFLCISCSFIFLIISFVNNDFSLRLVAEHSHSLQPLIYKIAAAWGNHEGSLLLWIWVLAFFACVIGLLGHKIHFSLRIRTIGVQSLIITGFLIFLIFASNPFLRNLPAELEGQALNPLLQDPGLAMHPPLLYLGFVGVSIVYSFAVAGLILGKIDPSFARALRPYALMAWIFLTAGIVLGARWAYYELGWGGFWFWDPVENASFMPWLITTALIHSVVVLERRGALASWTILLAICGFSLSLIGTFLVRSGVVSSVHAFATDPTRGVFILILLIIAIVGSLGFYAYRAPKLAVGNLFAPISKEGGLLLNNYLLCSAAFVVLIGTIYPLILEAINGDKITVGAPFYNLAFNPIMLILAIFLGVGLFLSWKRSPIKHIFHRLKYVLIASIIMIIAIYYIYQPHHLGAAMGCGLGVWVMGAACREFFGGFGQEIKFWQRRLSAFGSCFAHFGLGLMIIGICGASLLNGEAIAQLKIGDTIKFQEYSLKLIALRQVEGKNYTALEAQLQSDDGVNLLPQKRIYHNNRGDTTEAGIASRPWVDIYAAIGEVSNDNISVRLYIKPYAMLLWLGGIFMVLAGILSLIDLRARFAPPNQRKQ